MKKHILLIMILIVNIWAKDTQDVPAEDVPAVCQAFLDPDQRAIMLLPFKYGDKPIDVDINNDGVDENVTYSPPGHIVVSYHLSAYDKNNLNEYINFKYANDDYFEDVRWSGYTKILFFEHKYYIVAYRDNNAKEPFYISYINSKNIISPVCKLKNKISYKVVRHDKEYSDALCQSLREHVVKDDVITFDIPSKLEVNSKKKQYCDSHNYIGENIAFFDYNNDGKKEYLQMFEHQYNGKHVYALIDKSKTKLQKASDDYDCLHGTREWFYHNGTTYYFSGHKSDTKYKIGLYKYNEDKYVCQFEAEATTSIDTNTSTKTKKDK